MNDEKINEEQTEEQVRGPETIEEEELPGGPEPIEEEGPAVSDERILNKVIPSVIAQVAFAPAVTTGADGKPPDPQQLAAQYVAMTSQVLDLIDFHECLGGVGELSKTTRLIIGVATLAGGVFLMRPRPAKAKPAGAPQAKLVKEGRK